MEGVAPIRSTNFCRYCSSPKEPKTIRLDGTVLSGCSAAGTLPDDWIRRLCPSGRQPFRSVPEGPTTGKVRVARHRGVTGRRVIADLFRYANFSLPIVTATQL